MGHRKPSLGIGVIFTLVLVFLTAFPVFASAEAMCNPRENPIVCAMIEQRDNAMDDAARAEGGRREELAKSIAVASYWRNYVSGLKDQTELAKHINAVCSWRGTENLPTARLCSWWRPKR